MNALCFLFIFVFEQFVSYTYFNRKFYIKKKPSIVFLCYAVSFLIQYSMSFLDKPYVNLITFFVLNFFAAYICFEVQIKQILFNVILLEGIMICTETLIVYFVTVAMGVKLMSDSTTVLFLETAASKTLYFLVAYLITKYSAKERPVYKKDYSLPLFILPLASIVTIMSFTYIYLTVTPNKTIGFLISGISLFLLATNVAVFYIHEKTIHTLIENAQFQIEQEREKINQEYYINLEKQYDSSNILIHDIKNCLLNIRELSNETDNEKIKDYIDSIYSSYRIMDLKKYSSNKLINVIISRYAHLCEETKISLSVDIRNIDFSFITDGDLTALLDNLLENAFESAQKSKNKQIDLLIDKRNENYLLIDLKNSCDIQPKAKNGLFVSTKSDKEMHGIGLKSVLRIVKRYSGDINCEYENDENIFHSTVLLKMNKAQINETAVKAH